MRISVCILIAAFMVASFVASVPLEASISAEAESAPYLYYYSNVLHAFVIERADGTDSRTIGAGLMPEDYNSTGGPGWSPSGKWFAWTGTRNKGGGTTASSVWLVSTDGSYRLDGLEQVRLAETAGKVSWSPFEDKLLIVDDTQLDGRGYVYSLVDADAGQIVTLFETEVGWQILASTWASDGQYMMVYRVPPSTRDEAETQTFLRTVSLNGDVEDREIDGVPVGIAYPYSAISETGWILYHTPDGTKLIGENLFSGERVELNPLPDAIMQGWSPGGTYSLLWQKNTQTLWLLSIVEKQILPIAEHISDDTYSTVTMSYPVSQWSPTQDIAAFWTAEGQVQTLDALTHQVAPVVQDTGDMGYYWQADGVSLIIETGYKVSLYDAVVQTTRVIAEIELYMQLNTSLSPDRHYMGLFGFVKSPTIVDTQTGQPITFMPHSSASGWRVEAYRWHPDGMWVLAAENLTVGGGGSGVWSISVLKADGTFQRELTLINFSATGANWLPERVISYLADSQIQ